jgi:hypothetical protein
MFCAIIAFLATPLICQMADFLPSTRPPYAVTFSIYGPDPDCSNRDSHIRYLRKLKEYPVQRGDDPAEYDHAIDQYIARMEYYCS